MNGIIAVFRKELLDIVRDHKTLVFMLIIPTLVTPLLFWGASKLIIHIQLQQAVKTVRIVADEGTQERYRELVHRWFLETEMAGALRLANSPLVKVLSGGKGSEELAGVPEDVLDDPVAFEAWLGTVRQQIVDSLDTLEKRTEGPLAGAPKELRANALDFYEVAIKGFALVEFVDPAELPAPPEGFEVGELPEPLQALPHIAAVKHAIAKRDVHAYLVIPDELDSLTTQNEHTLEVLLAHDSTVSLSGEAFSRVDLVANRASNAEVEVRLKRLGLSPKLLDAVEINREADLATQSEVAANLIGGFLPYLLIAFAFLGGIYPAIDVGAGEKERNTLETLLLCPRSRLEIATGKFLVIMTTSLVAALLGMASIGASVKLLMPAGAQEVFQFEIDPLAGLMAALLVVPPAASFAGMFLALSIYARSFKEAQNYLAPLQFLFILPAMAPMIPGIEMNYKLAAIPLVNVSMIAKDLLKGDIHFGYYALTMASCGLLAAGCIAFAVWQFSREKVLFRS